MQAEMGARPADEAKQAPTQAANGKQQKADAGDAADSAVAKMSDPSSGQHNRAMTCSATCCCPTSTLNMKLCGHAV